jgi:crotonobetainyl-CoA:carnitine CoA-transferase CaiB-like acyl-CoA transferase
VDGKPPRVKASPILGQHTHDVLTTWLDMDAAEVKSLHNEGIV